MRYEIWANHAYMGTWQTEAGARNAAARFLLRYQIWSLLIKDVYE